MCFFSQGKMVVIISHLQLYGIIFILFLLERRMKKFAKNVREVFPPRLVTLKNKYFSVVHQLFPSKQSELFLSWKTVHSPLPSKQPNTRENEVSVELHNHTSCSVILQSGNGWEQVRVIQMKYTPFFFFCVCAFSLSVLNELNQKYSTLAETGE